MSAPSAQAVFAPVLPPGWEQRWDPHGRAYYVNHNANPALTQWEPPSVAGPPPPPPSAALPPGWEQRYDPSSRPYFVNTATGQTQWERPAAASFVPPPPAALPPGWEQRYDPSSRPYFLHLATGQTQWERPPMATAPPPAAFAPSPPAAVAAASVVVQVNATAAAAAAPPAAEPAALTPDQQKAILFLKSYSTQLQTLDGILREKVELKSKANKSLKDRLAGVSTNFTLTAKEKKALIDACHPLTEKVNHFLADWTAYSDKMTKRESGEIMIILSNMRDNLAVYLHNIRKSETVVKTLSDLLAKLQSIDVTLDMRVSYTNTAQQVTSITGTTVLTDGGRTKTIMLE